MNIDVGLNKTINVDSTGVVNLPLRKMIDVASHGAPSNFSLGEMLTTSDAKYDTVIIEAGESDFFRNDVKLYRTLKTSLFNEIGRYFEHF